MTLLFCQWRHTAIDYASHNNYSDDLIYVFRQCTLNSPSICKNATRTSFYQYAMMAVWIAGWRWNCGAGMGGENLWGWCAMGDIKILSCHCPPCTHVVYTASWILCCTVASKLAAIDPQWHCSSEFGVTLDLLVDINISAVHSPQHNYMLSCYPVILTLMSFYSY